MEALMTGLEEVANVRVSCSQQVEALERNRAEEAEGRASYATRIAMLELGLADVQASCEERVNALERCLTDKGLEERATNESKRLHIAMGHEIHEGRDVQNQMRDNVQYQQQQLMLLASHIDEALVELRSELPQIEKELNAQRSQINELQTLFDKCREHSEAVAVDITSIHEWLEALNSDVTKTQTTLNQRAAITEASVKSTHQLLEQVSGELLNTRETFGARADATAGNVQSAQELLGKLSHEVRTQLQISKEDSAKQLDNLQRQVQDLEKGLYDWVDSKLPKTDLGLRDWVDSTVVSRIKALENTLNQQMALKMLGTPVAPLSTSPGHQVRGNSVTPTRQRRRVNHSPGMRV